MTSNNEYLSQEEIDALLRQASTGAGEGIQETQNFMGDEDLLSPMEKDTLGEIGNITFGSAATALSTLLGKKVDITTPKVSIIAREDLNKEFPTPHVAVHVKYVEGFQGINLLVIRKQDAQVIADLMLGGDGKVQSEEINEIHISAVQEAMNQMMGSAATSMSAIFNRFVNISPPGINLMDLSTDEGKSEIPPEDHFVQISFRIIIGDLIDSNIMQLLPVDFAKEMVSGLLGSPGEPSSNELSEGMAEGEASAAAEAVRNEPQPQVHAAQQPNQPMYAPSTQPQMPTHADFGAYGGAPQPQAYGNVASRNVNVQPVQFASFSPDAPLHIDGTNLNLLMDIPLKVTVELGRTEKLIKEIIELSQGSVIELDKLAGEPVDILVNNKLIAKGEVVVIDENFGVRVTEIVSQLDRLQKLS